MCAERTYDGATPFKWWPLEILIDFLSAEEESTFRDSMWWGFSQKLFHVVDSRGIRLREFNAAFYTCQI